MARAKQNPVRDVTRHPIVPLVMVVVATIEVAYEWASILRGARRAVTGWWDTVEHREHQEAMRTGMRWLASRFDSPGAGTGTQG
jgi:hypothetical protein